MGVRTEKEDMRLIVVLLLWVKDLYNALMLGTS